MIQTAPVLTTQKRSYLKQACLASFCGGHQLNQPSKLYIIQVIIQLVSVIQTYIFGKEVDNYFVVLIVPALINTVLLIIMNCLIIEDYHKTKSQIGLFFGILILQTIGTASAIKYDGTIFDAIVFFLLFPREQKIELGFTQMEEYSRSKYACLFLKLILILTHVNRMIIANIIRYIYYFTPILIWIGLLGQFSQFLEYVGEQFNFLMGSSYQSSQKRTYLTVLLNVALIAICLGLSYLNESRCAIIVSGILINIKMFNIFGSIIPQDQNQIYKQNYLDRQYYIYTGLSALLNLISIILCGILGPSYYKEFYYAIFFVFIGYMIIQFKFQQCVKYYKIFYTLIECACISMMDYNFEGIFAQRLFECTTIIRLYSLIHSNPIYLFFEQFVCCIVSLTTNYSMSQCQLIGFLVQIGLRFGIRMKSRLFIWVIANHKMLTVKKQKVEGAALITSLQLILCPLPFLIMIISSILDSPYMPLFGLPIFYFASLRPFRNTIHIQKQIQNSSEGQIYHFYMSKAFDKLLGSQPLWSHYIIRIGKYLGLMQVLESQGGYAVIQFKGLESQETTSCHGIEAREVDRLVNAQDCGSFFGSALTLQNQFKVTSYEENQINLTGIIEATEFVSGLKQMYLKMLCYYVQNLNEDNKKSILELSNRYDGYENQFPSSFADLIKLQNKLISFKSKNLHQQVEINQQTKPQPSVQQDTDEFWGLIDDFDQPTTQQHKQLHQQNTSQQSEGFYNHIQRAILYIYQVSLGDLDFNFESRINKKVLFNLFKNSDTLYEQRQMKGVDRILSEIATLAIRTALKISLDFYSIEGHMKIDDTELLQELNGMNNCFVGMGSDEGWQRAMISNLFLCSLGYDPGKNQLTVYRHSYTEMLCQVFQFDSEVIRGIEANLQMELLFATNNDEERYLSIIKKILYLNHEQFFRNMIIEGSELPLGYAPFYSGPVLISLR